MNDEKEYFEGLSILEGHFNSGLLKIDPKTKKIVESLLENVKKIYIFSTSFSKENNLLSQWRSYCPSDGGLAIGFDKKILEKHICGYNAKNNIRYIQECCYDEVHSNKIAKIISESTFKHMEEIGNSPIRGKQFKNNTFLEIITFLARSKNQHFSEESEVRLFTYSHKEFKSVDIIDTCNSPSIEMISPEDVSFRTKKNFLVPYLKVKLPLDAIKTINIGPSPYQDIAEESICMFLASKGLIDKVEIMKSPIPYRAL